MSDLPEGTQEGLSSIPSVIPKASPPLCYTLPLRIQISPLQVSYFLQSIPSGLKMIVDNFSFFNFFPVARIRHDLESTHKTSFMPEGLGLQVWLCLADLTGK